MRKKHLFVICLFCLFLASCQSSGTSSQFSSNKNQIFQENIENQGSDLQEEKFLDESYFTKEQLAFIDKIYPKKTDPYFMQITESMLTEEEESFVEKVKRTHGIHQINDIYIIAGNYDHSLVQYVGEKKEKQTLLVYVKETDVCNSFGNEYIIGKINEEKLNKISKVKIINIDTNQTF